MFFIVTKPPEFVAGFYEASEVSHEVAAKLMREHHASKTCKPFIFHRSTQRALRELTGIKFEMVQKSEMPVPRDGDQFLRVKVNKESPGIPALADHCFLKITYSSQDN